MILLKINSKHLCQIFTPDVDISTWSNEQIQDYSSQMQMLPTEVMLTSETYSRDADRTADYELENLTLVNRKAKPEFTWSLLRAEYVEALLLFLNYSYDFKGSEGDIVPQEADKIVVTYRDFVGSRTINAYMGQTIEGTLVEHNGVQYWENFRVSFPER